MTDLDPADLDRMATAAVDRHPPNVPTMAWIQNRASRRRRRRQLATAAVSIAAVGIVSLGVLRLRDGSGATEVVATAESDPSDSSGQPAQRIEIPDVVGLSLPEAVARIEATGLIANVVDGAGDVVLATDPAGGTYVEPGSTIILATQKPSVGDVPTLATSGATPAPVIVGATPDFGTFHNRNGCVVLDNQADGMTYAVTVPAEGGGFLINDGTGIQIPMHKVTFDDPVVYAVGGFPMPTDGSVDFVQPPGPACPTEAFVVLETRLGDQQPPAGTALAVVLDCSQNTADCPIQIAYNGKIWVALESGSSQPAANELLASEIDGLDSATLWSTSQEDRVVLITTDSTPPIELQPKP